VRVDRVVVARFKEDESMSVRNVLWLGASTPVWILERGDAEREVEETTDTERETDNETDDRT
jgi:hypothetical protein